MRNKSKPALKVAILIVVAMISFLGISRYASSPSFHRKPSASLDEKKTTVMELAAAATAASVAVSAIPSDVATPIADELAELSSYFLIILSAIFLEKYLVTITGYVTFRILIPLACIMILANIRVKSDVIKNAVKKMLLIGAVLVFTIPVGERISGLIQNTADSSIEELIATVEESEESEETEEGLLSSVWNAVVDGATGAVDAVKDVLNQFIEAIAIMVVTCCVIPILVLVFMIWCVKFILGVNINLPKKEDLMIVKKGLYKIRNYKEKNLADEE